MQVVLAAAFENGGSLDSVEQCQQACQTLWNLELDRDEVEAEILRLVGAGKLERGRSRGYRLTEDVEIEYVEKAQASKFTEDQAVAEWAVAVRAMDPSLSERDLDLLKKDLVDWLQQLIAHHGMEAALILYPEQAEDRAEEFLSLVKAAGCDFLPARPEPLAAVRENSLFLFLRNPTNNQRSYLANLMTTAYLMAVFTIDPGAHEVVKKLTRGQVIYLDTNVVYDLLNLSGPKKFLSIRRILELTRNLGYEIYVTPWTVSEMKESVRKARDEIAKVALPPKALADLAAEACGDDGFLTAYWRKYKETGVRPQDFFDFHEQIEGLLEEAGIRISSEGCIAVDRDERGLADRSSLLASIPGGEIKPTLVLEHDVKHRMLIERLRGDSSRRFSNAGYWFLTDDSVLMRFARSHRANHREIPFAVSLSSWTHIVRALSPRTDDYEQTMVDLLDTSAVMPRGVVSSATVSEVLGRVEMLAKDSTQEIATRMLLDRAVMAQVEKRTGKSRDRFVKSAIKEKSGELERELQEVKAAVEAEREARESSERRVVKQEERLRREKARRSEAERRIAEIGKDRRQEESRAASELNVQADKRQRAERERDRAIQLRSADVEQLEGRLLAQEVAVRRHENFIRWMVAFAIAGLGLATLVVPLLAGWVTGGWPLVLVVMASLGILVGAVAWLYGWRKAGAVASIVGLVIGTASALYGATTSEKGPAQRGSVRSSSP